MGDERRWRPGTRSQALRVGSDELEDLGDETGLPDGLRVGDLVDGVYRIERVLGRGGMGVVFLARDERLERDVALKVIAPHAIADANARTLFQTEARAMAGVRHANVVQIFAYGEDAARRPFFAMEHVPGASVADWLERWADPSTAPSLDEVLGILEQVCRGLGAIHAQGIVHADVKPGNVLIGPSFRVAVTDFGLVRALGEKDRNELVVGTPAFIAPEVVYSREPVFDSRADVYSAGVMAFEMLTGELPFPISNVGELFDVHLRKLPPPRPSDVRPDLPPAFDEVLLRALARDVEARYPTTDALRKALLGARQSVALGPRRVRVLLADDDRDFLALGREALTFAFPEPEIVEATDGEAALAALDERRADLAVIDLDMPGLNGIELTAAIRARPHLKKMPIIVVTAYGGGKDWQLLQALGADGFLVKPLDPYALVAMARRAVGHGEG